MAVAVVVFLEKSPINRLKSAFWQALSSTVEGAKEPELVAGAKSRCSELGNWALRLWGRMSWRFLSGKVWFRYSVI